MSDTELAELVDTSAEDETPVGKKSPTTGTKDIEDGDSSFTRKKKKKKASKGKGRHSGNSSGNSEINQNSPLSESGECVSVSDNEIGNIEEEEEALRAPVVEEQQEVVGEAEEGEDQSPHRKKRRRKGHVQASVIIAAVIIVQDGKLLMQQEAKAACRGKWYIPAGRVETGESPFAGAEREVEEETGLVMEATGVFSIEYKPTRRLRGSGYNNWIRYGITGKIVGGSLKTEEDADKESLQAQWVPLEGVKDLELRNEDLLRLLARYNEDTTIPLVYSLKK